MAKHNVTTIKEFTLTGTGNQVKEFDFAPQVAVTADKTGAASSAYVRINGKLSRFYVREDAGGGATAATFYFFNRSQRTVTSPSTAAKDKVVAYTSSVPLTASATASSLDTPFDQKPVFRDSLTLVADVTAVGAWTLVGYVEIIEQ